MPSGASGSCNARVWTYRRAWQKAVRRKMFFPKYVNAQSDYSSIVLSVFKYNGLKEEVPM